MGQFLISNKDSGTTVTPSRPRTGTEVQVQNTQERVQDARNNQLIHGEQRQKWKKLGLVPPNGKMTTARGSFAVFGQQYPTNPLNIMLVVFLQSSFGSGSFLMPLFLVKYNQVQVTMTPQHHTMERLAQICIPVLFWLRMKRQILN